MPTTAIIAGEGELPRLCAEGARAAGHRVLGLGMRGLFAADFPAACDEFRTVGFLRPGGWIRAARRAGCEDAVLIGRVSKQVMHRKRFKIMLLREMPDLYCLNVWYRRLRFDRRSATLLRTLADDLAVRGLVLVDSTTYLPEHLATEGPMTALAPTAEALSDIDFGWPLLTQVSGLHIGQSMAVRQRDVVCVEAVEGTDRMIKRAGELCPRGGWTLLKTAAPDHDMRSDVPTIGLRTIEHAAAAGCSCIAIETGRVILADRPKVLADAGAAGIAFVGMPATVGGSRHD